MSNVYESSGYSLDKSAVKISGPDKYGVSKYEYPFLLHKHSNSAPDFSPGMNLNYNGTL